MIQKRREEFRYLSYKRTVPQYKTIEIISKCFLLTSEEQEGEKKILQSGWSWAGNRRRSWGCCVRSKQSSSTSSSSSRTSWSTPTRHTYSTKRFCRLASLSLMAMSGGKKERGEQRLSGRPHGLFLEAVSNQVGEAQQNQSLYGLFRLAWLRHPDWSYQWSRECSGVFHQPFATSVTAALTDLTDIDMA